MTKVEGTLHDRKLGRREKHVAARPLGNPWDIFFFEWPHGRVAARRNVLGLRVKGVD